jgi:hypothetical protein
MLMLANGLITLLGCFALCILGQDLFFAILVCHGFFPRLKV